MIELKFNENLKNGEIILPDIKRKQFRRRYEENTERKLINFKLKKSNLLLDYKFMTSVVDDNLRFDLN